MSMHLPALQPDARAVAPVAPVATVDFVAMLEHMQVAVFIDQDDRFRYVNANLSTLFGYAPAELLGGLGMPDLTLAEDRARVIEERRQRAAGVPGHAYDIGCRRRDGSSFTARLHGTRFELDGRPAHLVTLQDVSELKQATRAAEQRAELLAQTEQLALIGSVDFDVATGQVTQSAGMYRILGLAPVEGPIDGEWLMRRVPRDERSRVRSILHSVMPGQPCEFEHRIIRTDGSLRTVLHRAMAEANAAGRTVRVVGILQDITAQRRAEQQLDLQTRTDLVTGLPNRSALLDALDLGLSQAQREGQALALLVIEIDQLKLVSDSLGYASGDRLLAAVGARLSEQIQASAQAHRRNADLLAHLGSGEFAVLLGVGEGIAEADALGAAQALTRAFSVPFVIDANEVGVTCAVGLTQSPRDGEHADQLLHQAQAARHRARLQEAPRICVFTPEAHAKSASRLALEASLRRALERGQFELLYQPQLDLASGRPTGVEALLRWNDPQRGRVSPLDFIPLAEETGLIVPIGEWVLRTACQQNLAWQRAGLPPLRVAVNLSVKQLQQPDIARRIHTILLETGLQPRHLGLEITESVLVGESAHVARVLGELKAMGIEISLDDFGTGYSNLSYLRTLPIDVVKVDRSLVHDVTAAPQQVSMTRAVITMAHSLQMKVLAEGVETEGQLALLIANRCDQMQGFFFSPPVTADAVADLLREGRRLPDHLLQHRGRQRSLLLVDDDPEVLALLARLLQRDDRRIVCASSGEQGLQRLAEEDIDVIVSDQLMPGMSGVEFLRRAKTLRPDSVRIVLSGNVELQSITDAVNEGAIYKFLNKPWDNERLRAHIKEAFRHKELADENRRLGGTVQSAYQELAEVNRRLQALLQSQREKIRREENSGTVTRQLLESVPAPLIGFDDEGLIAFANADAEALFAHQSGNAGQGLLGREAHEVLPAALLRVWQRSDGATQALEVGGHAYLAVCRSIGEHARSQGKLLVLTPAGQTGQAGQDTDGHGTVNQAAERQCQGSVARFQHAST